MEEVIYTSFIDPNLIPYCDSRSSAGRIREWWTGCGRPICEISLSKEPGSYVPSSLSPNVLKQDTLSTKESSRSTCTHDRPLQGRSPRGRLMYLTPKRNHIRYEVDKMPAGSGLDDAEYPDLGIGASQFHALQNAPDHIDKAREPTEEEKGPGLDWNESQE